MTGRVEERHGRILQLVRERGTMRVLELAEELGMSQETMRRDVLALAEIGRVRRIHGKVAWPTAELSARDARLARHATTGDLPVIGMIVPVAAYVHHDIIRGARAAAQRAGARLLVSVTAPGEPDQVQLRALAKAGMDGLLLTPTWQVDGPTAEDLASLVDFDVPAVILDRDIPPGTPAAWLDRVSSDHANGAARAVRHLAGLGHQRIALLARRTPSEPQIRDGYRAAVDALGLPREEIGAPEGAGATFEDRLDVLAAMAREKGVRAALVHTDNDAVNVLYRLNAEGVRVPEDFALISYGDDLPALTEVPLTAIAPAERAIGEAAITLILRRLADPTAQRQHISLVPDLNLRRSCGTTAEQPRVPMPRRQQDPPPHR